MGTSSGLHAGSCIPSLALGEGPEPEGPVRAPFSTVCPRCPTCNVGPFGSSPFCETPTGLCDSVNANCMTCNPACTAMRFGCMADALPLFTLRTARIGRLPALPCAARPSGSSHRRMRRCYRPLSKPSRRSHHPQRHLLQPSPRLCVVVQGTCAALRGSCSHQRASSIPHIRHCVRAPPFPTAFSPSRSSPGTSPCSWPRGSSPPRSPAATPWC